MFRKIISGVFCALLLAGLCACGQGSSEKGQVFTSSVAENRQSVALTETENESESTAGRLTVLCDDELYAHCGTEDGYYYIAEPSYEKEGAMKVYQDYAHIMYADYATRQEVYLCSDAGCQHDTETCSAVLSTDEFPLDSTRIFVWNGKLYALSREEDSESGISIEYVSIGADEFVEVESHPAVLYRMNLDGSNREKVYTLLYREKMKLSMSNHALKR